VVERLTRTPTVQLTAARQPGAGRAGGPRAGGSVPRPAAVSATRRTQRLASHQVSEWPATT